MTQARLERALPARLYWFAILVPAVATGGFEWIRHSYLERVMPTDLGNVIAAVVVAAGSTIFVRVLYRLIVNATRALHQEQAEAARLRERAALAADLHDGILQAFFLLGVQAGQAEAALAAGEGDRARALVGAVRTTLSDEEQRLRGVVTQLAQPATGPRDLIAWLDERRGDFSRLAGTPVEVRGRGSWRLPERTTVELEAILREAFLNVRRHAEARHARLQVEPASGGLAIRLQDDGAGFDPGQPAEGMGLAIMRQRAGRIGGQLEVTSAPGRGTSLRLWLPVGGATA